MGSTNDEQISRRPWLVVCSRISIFPNWKDKNKNISFQPVFICQWLNQFVFHNNDKIRVCHTNGVLISLLKNRITQMYSKIVKSCIWHSKVLKNSLWVRLCVYLWLWIFCGTPYVNVYVCFCFHFGKKIVHFDWLKESGWKDIWQKNKFGAFSYGLWLSSLTLNWNPQNNDDRGEA